MAPNLHQIFTDFNNDGWRESFREFLGFFVKQFFPFINTQIEKLYFARLDYPLVVFPFYLLAIIALIVFWKKPQRSTAIFAAITAGSLFYLYFHFWVYWVIVISLLFLYTLIYERKDRKRLINFFVLIGTLALIALPYFINYFRFATANTQDFIFRLGIASGRVFGLATMGYTYLFYIALALGVYFLYWKKRGLNPDFKYKAILYWSFLTAMFVVWNIQIIVGYVPAPNNWRRTVSPIMFLIIFDFIYEFTRRLEIRKPTTKQWATLVLVFLTAMVAIKKVINVYSIYRDPEPRVINGQTLPNEILESFQWINENLGKEPKIISNSFVTSLYLTAYTGARPFLPLGIMTPMSNSILESRYLISQKIFKVPELIVARSLKKDLLVICQEKNCIPNTEDNLRKNVWHLYGHYFRRGDFDSYMNNPLDISNSYIDKLVEQYPRIDTSWQSIDARFVYYGPWEKQLGAIDPSNDPNLERIFENKLIKIYRIKK